MECMLIVLFIKLNYDLNLKANYFKSIGFLYCISSRVALLLDIRSLRRPVLTDGRFSSSLVSSSGCYILSVKSRLTAGAEDGLISRF